MSTTVNGAGARRSTPSLPDAPHTAPAPVGIPPLIRRNTILLALTQAFVGMGNQTTPTLAPIIVVQMLGSAALSGLGTSILGVSRLVIAYPVGWLTDRYGRKAGLMLGLSLALIGSLVIGLAMAMSSFPLVVLGLVIFGLGVGAGQQLRLAAADMFVPARRGEGLGYVLTGSLIGAIAAPLLFAGGEQLAAWTGGDRLSVIWYLLPLVLVPSMLLVRMIRPDPKTIAQNLEAFYPGYKEPERMVGEPTGSLRIWLRHLPLATAFANSFAALGVMSMMMAMTSLALDHHGYSLSLISISVSLHVVGMFGFSIPFGRLSDRIGRRNVMLIGNVIVAIGSILVPTSPDYLVITAGTFFVGLGWSCINVASSALITEVVGPAERGRAIGLSDTISQSSSIVLPLSAGPLVEWAGLPALAVVALAVLAVPVIMLARLRETAPGEYAHELHQRAVVDGVKD